jgi:hypothetical protein
MRADALSGNKFFEGQQRPNRCELLLIRSLSFFLKKKSQTVRRDFSRSVPETFAMVDGRMVDGHADGRG